MKKFQIILLILLTNMLFCQTIKDKYESSQSQDFSVPPAPRVTFPAQFPGGNKLFLENVSKNIDKTFIQSLSKSLSTKIILKIDNSGKVLNISTYSNNKIFDKEVKRATEKANGNTVWEPGKNKSGENVIDIVILPFKFKN